MINLKNTCILVRTKEENEMLLKEAEKQGFHWFGRSDCQPLKIQHFPDILKFSNSKDVVYNARIGAEDSTFYEASELLGGKEMTAREFIKWYVNVDFSCGDVTVMNVYLAERTLSATISCVLHATGKTTLMNFLKLRNQVELQFLHPKRKQLARLKILSRIQTAQR